MGNGSLDVSALIGEKAGLSQWEFAFEQMDKGKVIKSVLFPEN